MNTPCLKCGYCCKKATCAIGISYGADPTNCMFLLGDKPGGYHCWLVDADIHPTIRTDLAIGDGCCEPLASRNIMGEAGH